MPGVDRGEEGAVREEDGDAETNRNDWGFIEGPHVGLGREGLTNYACQSRHQRHVAIACANRHFRALMGVSRLFLPPSISVPLSRPDPDRRVLAPISPFHYVLALG